ncbi:MAG: FkbM family methyltransferase [Chitinophagaceae bacterium]
MNIIKLIWRKALKIYKNSKLQVLTSKVLEKLKFEGFYLSYSQFGEDIILENIFRGKGKGIYIDVGCNRPIEGNNTFKMYLSGWRGINIDGNKELIESFNKVRPEDININAIISDSKEKVKFYISRDDRVSTISEEFKEWIKDNRSYETYIEVIPKTLTEIVSKHLKPDDKIDFLNVDVEGHDLEVIKSINLEVFRPEIICVEDHLFDFQIKEDSKLYTYLTENQYKLIAFSRPNLFFQNINKQ